MVSRVEYLVPNFNNHLYSKVYLALEEVVGARQHKLHNFFKGLFDCTSEKVVTTKYQDDKVMQTYFKIIVITNEIHVQQSGTKERRWWFFSVNDDEWIETHWPQLAPYDSKQNFSSRSEYFAYLANVDIMCWADVLLSQDISNFNVHRDAPKNEDTVAQKELSLPKSEPALAFWSDLALNDLRDAPPSQLSQSSSTSSSCIPRRAWVFCPETKSDWKKLNELIKTHLADAAGENKDIQSIIDKISQKEVQKYPSLDLEFNAEVKELLDEWLPEDARAKSISLWF